MDRRHFLTAAAGGAAVALAPAAAPAIEPIHRNGKPHLRLSLAAYSYRKYLDLKAKPRPEMTLDDFVDHCAAMDLDAVEFTQYYFPESSSDYLARLKGRCTRLGLDVSGTAVGNDFCVRDPDKLKLQIAAVKQWTENTARLGGKTMRIFAGKIEKGEDEDKARARCVEAIQEVCDHAAKQGVILAMENHGGITATADQVLVIVKAVKHDWFGLNLDTGNFHVADPYAELKKIAMYAVVVQIKTEIQRDSGAKEEADLKRKLDLLRDVNYRGYVALEYEAAEEPKVAVPKYVKELKKLLA